MRLIDADIVCKNCSFIIPDHENKCGFQNCLMKTLPTIEAEPVKHGRWEDGAFENSKKCSICGRYATKIHAYNQPVFDYVVCPYCGAKMDLEGE